MGLDMYLNIRKEEYISKYSSCPTLSLTYPEDITKFIPQQDDSINGTFASVSRTTEYKVGYWRKANQIHNWFLEHCGPRDYETGELIDDCRPIEVPVGQLEELLETCKKVLEDHSLAGELLPTQKGFFFGSTEYDEYYFEDLEYTIKTITPIIDFLKEKLEKKEYEWDLVYQASW